MSNALNESLISENATLLLMGGAPVQDEGNKIAFLYNTVSLLHLWFWPIIELLVVFLLVVVFKYQLRRTNSALYLEATANEKQKKRLLSDQKIVEKEEETPTDESLLEQVTSKTPPRVNIRLARGVPLPKLPRNAGSKNLIG